MNNKVFIKNKSGLKIASIVEVSEDKDKYPFVIMLHGFKGYKEEPTYSELAKMLLEKGIGSIRFDATGFGESEGTIDDEYRFSNYLNDTERVYNWLKNQKIVNNQRIGLMGHSVGAMMTIVFASKNKDVKSLVAVSPADIFATRDDFGGKLKLWKKQGYLKVNSSQAVGGYVKVPYKYVEDIQNYDIREYVQKVNIPKLFILGLKDKTVIPDQTRDIYKAALRPKKLIEIKDMDHFYKNNSKVLEKVNKIITDFFVKNL
jgi:dipeptidyl aminopeptidase/acylaminoacyl peptidase